MSITLAVYTANAMFLDEAVRAYSHLLQPPPAMAYALLYAPQLCCFARLDTTGVLRDPQGDPVPTATVFEAYVFNADVELRWLHTEARRGQVAVLSEDAHLDLFGGPQRCDPMHGRIPQHYLLWGTGTTTVPGPGWSQLAEARTGAFAVPIAHVGPEKRVQLTAVEYLSVYEHGNVGVCEERLTGLTIAA